MSKFIRNLLIFLIIATSVMFTGCWNYREINEMAIVTALTIDKNNVSNKYNIAVEIIVAQIGQKGGGVGSAIYESQGDTVFEAIRDLVSSVGRRLYWSHNKVIIISKTIAESDISPVLDWVYRDQELRFEMNILISKCPTAKEILYLSPELEKIMGLNLSQTIKSQKNTNRFPKAELGDVAANFCKQEKSILIPLVGKQKEISNSTDLMGSAILKRESVVGYLSGEDTFNALWVQGKVKTGTFIVEDLIKPKTNATIEIFNSKTRTKAINFSGKKEIVVNITADVGLAELSDIVPFQKNEEQKRIKEAIEKNIEERLTNTIKKVQFDYKADIFEIGHKVRINDKNYYKKVSSNWGEEFSSIPVEVNAEVHIRGTGVESQQIKGRE